MKAARIVPLTLRQSDAAGPLWASPAPPTPVSPRYKTADTPHLTYPPHLCGSAQGFWDFLQDQRRVSGTIRASRAEQRPLSHREMAHFTWNPTASPFFPTSHTNASHSLTSPLRFTLRPARSLARRHRGCQGAAVMQPTCIIMRRAAGGLAPLGASTRARVAPPCPRRRRRLRSPPRRGPQLRPSG